MAQNRLSGLEIETKEADDDIQKFQISQCMPDDLKFKKRKNSDGKKCIFKSSCLLRCEMCS